MLQDKDIIVAPTSPRFDLEGNELVLSSTSRGWGLLDAAHIVGREYANTTFPTYAHHLEIVNVACRWVFARAVGWSSGGLVAGVESNELMEFTRWLVRGDDRPSHITPLEHHTEDEPVTVMRSSCGVYYVLKQREWL